MGSASDLALPDVSPDAGSGDVDPDLAPDLAPDGEPPEAGGETAPPESEECPGAGVRAIYYFHVGQHAVYMLTLYAKSEQADLTEADARDMKKIVARLKGRVLR